MAWIDLASFVSRNERRNHYVMWYSTLCITSFKTMYMKSDGFSTLVISFWLIRTTRRWDRGSVWGHTLFFSKKLVFFLASMRKPIFSVDGD